MKDQIAHYENKLKYETDPMTSGNPSRWARTSSWWTRVPRKPTRNAISPAPSISLTGPWIRRPRATWTKHPLRDLLRRHRVQRVDQRRAQHGQAGFQREGTHGRPGLVDERPATKPKACRPPKAKRWSAAADSTLPLSYHSAWRDGLRLPILRNSALISPSAPTLTYTATTAKSNRQRTNTTAQSALQNSITPPPSGLRRPGDPETPATRRT